jgi:release factor glutamine methyltransferase
VIARLRAAGCVFAEDEARLLFEASTGPEHLDRLVRRRVGGEPLEQILGWAEFCGLRLVVEPGVFVPRARTALLVEQALLLLAARASVRRRTVVVDLCCGCGAVGAALARSGGRLELHAADLDEAAVRCARRNLAGLGRVHQGDLFAALPAQLSGRVDVLVANAPYVPTEEIAFMPPEARLHESPVALDGGRDGLGVVRRILARADRWLAPGGTLLVESSRRQAPVAVELAVAAGLRPRVVTSEDLDATALVAPRP